MTIALIVYGISWGLLLLIYLYSRFFQGNSTEISDEPWYLYAIIILFAPLVILIIPYILIKDAVDKKKNKKWKKEQDKKQKLVELHRQQAIANFDNGTPVSILSEFAHKGRQLKNIVKGKLYENILGCLNKLSLPVGYTLDIKLAEHKGSGDRSTLFVTEPCGDTCDVIESINVEDSAEGAMNVCLLYKMWHYLPLFWHANYSHRTYVYSKDELTDISMFREEEKASVVKILQQFDLTPAVVKNQGKYYVSCCFWSDFGGLIRELVEIEIKENKVVDIFDASQTTLFEYQCGIMY